MAFGVGEVGRGAVLSGGAAQVRLLPATTLHPDQGQAGDLFLDKNVDLWLCKGGTRWVQIA